MATEETQLHDPVTPAPVFAYRALRSIFYASPDSSPETNKENNRKLSPKHASPRKAKVATFAVPPKLTPQKRKTSSNDVVSPTKSILRTPGAVTPRRAMLRDLNVTFKDARMSVSPQLARKVKSPVKATVGGDVKIAISQPGNPKGTTEEIFGTVSTQHSERVMSPMKQRAVTNIQSSHPPSKDTGRQWPSTTEATFTMADIEAYMRNTEKEMKRLVRHAQKMRDYARKQDAENTRLRKLVEDLQEENERLRKAEVRRAGKDEEVETRDSMTKASNVSSCKTATLGIEGEAPIIGILDNRPVVRERFDLHAKELQITAQPTNDHSVRDHQSLPETQPLRATSARITPRREKPLVTEKSFDRNIQKPNHVSTKPRTDSIKGGSVRLPPERVNAVRERLKKKAQLRKTSTETADSQVDWADL